MAGVDLERLRALFVTEARELVQTLERGALALEAKPDDSEQLNEVFRAAHSLKGGAGICGFDQVGALTHVLETMLDAWRAGELTPHAHHFASLLRSADVLGSLIELDPSAEPGQEYLELQAELNALCGPVGHGPEPSAAAAAASSSGHPAIVSAAPRHFSGRPAEGRYRIHFTPQPDALQFGGDPLLVLRELKSYAADFQVALDVSRVPSLAQLSPDTSYFGWTIELTLALDAEERNLHDALAFFDGLAVVSVDKLAPRDPDAPSRETTRPSGPVAAEVAAKPADVSTIRVATDKVDKIIDVMGELVIAHSAVRELVRTSAAGPALQEAVLLAERHLRELQGRVMSVRMVPVSSTFGRLPRMVRDLGKKLAKSVHLELRGTETELDKTLAEKLGDPLGHLVRNALDHGVETPAERAAAGKSETAQVTVSAYARGGNVFIEVRDDGRGLDRERIRSLAIERGVIGGADVLGDEQVFKLICSPGFSTKQTVTDVSGRGVGLDVVQRNLEELGGDLEIESERGRGTCFRLRLPLTLAIIDGLLLSAAGQTCVLPLVDIAYSHRVLPGQVQELIGAGLILDVSGEALPMLDLAAMLGGPANDAAPGTLAVVVASGQFRYALRVDALLGQSQAVVKSLETHFRRVPGIMGATILGDGRVALILDAQGIAVAAGLRRGRVEPTHNRGSEARAHAVQ
jgi:two-component system, chemotaxis family, sensor kinase CheA